MASKLQLTLAILKPDITAHPNRVKDIISIILSNQFLFVKSQTLTLTQKQAGDFYKEHEGKFFHKRLQLYMSSGPINTHILARRDAIQEWRKLMGATKVYKTRFGTPNSIRGQHGLTDTRNTVHGSDSEPSAKSEIEFFFPDFSVEQWYESQEHLYRQGSLVFDERVTEHRFVDWSDEHPGPDHLLD